MALGIFDVPPKYDLQIVRRWALQGPASLRRFAPYAAHVLAVELSFQIALGAGLIGTANANNRTDIGYLYYCVIACNQQESLLQKEGGSLARALRPSPKFYLGDEFGTEAGVEAN